MSKKLDLCGQRFGRLVVICENGRAKGGFVLWLCRCDCGVEVTVSSSHLRSGNTISCGCLHREIAAELGKRKTKHGMRKTRLYRVWSGMLVRTGVYKGSGERTKRDYQDRGITLCEEWESFENFRDWALAHGYADDLQIDRVNNDKGYEPSNCRWLTPKENCNNRRNTLRLPDGTPLALFCSKVGIETRGENGRKSKQYARIKQMYTRHHKAHQELIQKANETILNYRKCVELRKLLDEVKHLKQTLRQGLKN